MFPLSKQILPVLLPKTLEMKFSPKRQKTLLLGDILTVHLKCFISILFSMDKVTTTK
jgi:hypothetical protein